jgi:hypothetical protein|tara:strand:- start:334 stop:525 length:192 start_codon:yes stop_codon:yes gene_type:complete
MHEHKLSKEDRNLLRIVVKQVHLKHYPKEFITDREADKLIASLLPHTLERIKEVGRNYNIDKL